MKRIIVVSLISLSIVSSKVVFTLPLSKPNYALGYHRSSPSYFIPKEYKYTVERECNAMAVPVWLIARLINRESGWNNTLVNTNKDGTKDLGLCQLNTKYLADFSWRYNDFVTIDPFNPEVSIKVACRIVKALYKSTGNWVDAIAAYNAGLSRVRSGDIPESTLRHIDAIFGGI